MMTSCTCHESCVCSRCVFEGSACWRAWADAWRFWASPSSRASSLIHYSHLRHTVPSPSGPWPSAQLQPRAGRRADWRPRPSCASTSRQVRAYPSCFCFVKMKKMFFFFWSDFFCRGFCRASEETPEWGGCGLVRGAASATRHVTHSLLRQLRWIQSSLWTQLGEFLGAQLALDILLILGWGRVATCTSLAADLLQPRA